MKTLTTMIILTIATIVSSQKLPEGIRMDTVACFYAEGFNQHHFYKNNVVIASIVPEDCSNGYVEVHKKNPPYFAEFYPTGKKNTFATLNEAITWLISSFDKYYKKKANKK